MRISTLKPFFLIIGMLGAASADAMITKNGIRYSEYSKSARCLDGSAKLRYLSKYWCPIYSASLSWNAPVTRTNGKPLSPSDISAYEVYWTREVDTRKGTAKKASAIKSTTLYFWTPDTYHFAISAIDLAGRKSPLSKVVSARLGK